MSLRAVSIAGVGCTPFGAHPDTPIHELALRAARAAIDEAGVARADIGSLYLGNFIGGMLTGQEVLAGLVGDALGLANVPCTKVEGACASGGIAFRHACLMVACGQCDAALAVGVEKMTHAGTAHITAALNAAMDQLADARSGLTYPGLYAMAWRAHAARHGTSREQVSAVVIKNKANGLRNPLAQMGAALDAQAIADSKPIADPVRLFDCCAPGDGAAAVLVVARERAGAGGALPVDVRASVQTRGAARLASHRDITSFEATVSAAREAYRQAGIGPRDLDFVELHDCFSIAEILDAEDLGLMPRGHGGGWSLEGRTGMAGDLPINASGGLLAKGHPVGATGLGQIYEAVAQLRGTHPNQVRGAAIGLTHNLGGTGIACTVNILARPDA
jgi:acetyl-CoA C-acetyltransferase